MNIKQIDDGGLAFPGLNAEFTGISSDGQDRYDIQPSGGMTLRDYFAAKALVGCFNFWVQVNAKTAIGDPNPEAITRLAYEYADAMIKARKS